MIFDVHVVFALNTVYETCDLGIMRKREENEDILLFRKGCFSHDCLVVVVEE